jgi:NADP-dependent 3-hydroxy acid dehydrogenase YdfG
VARLQDKVVIITGSSSGFGRGIAKACAAAEMTNPNPATTQRTIRHITQI